MLLLPSVRLLLRLRPPLRLKLLLPLRQKLLLLKRLPPLNKLLQMNKKACPMVRGHAFF
jgi:hypothetical protein